MNDFKSMAEESTEEEEVVITGTRNGDSTSEKRKGCDYKAFKGCNPPSLMVRRMPGHLHWVSAMKQLSPSSECREDQAVKLQLIHLLEEALHWWNTVKQSKTLLMWRA
ncbi:hypothetical protein R6Q59_000279 [Mikania micrantha]